jgi:hypothetical protein
MPLFIDSQSQARGPGVYAIEITPPRVIDEVSNGYIGLVGQFDWGPKQSVYVPSDGADFLDVFAPAGSGRASTGYYATMRRRGLTLKVVRVLGSGSAAASDSAAGTGGNLVSTAKYHGTMGNSIARTIGAASGGDATKRDITFTLTNSVTGTTTEVYRDIAMNQTIDVSRSKLLASLVFSGGTMTVWPSNGTVNLAGGSNGGALASSDYTGTAGAADKGCALFETHDDVRVVMHDDCGNTNRASINAAFATHAATLRDRLAVVSGNSDAADWSTVKGYRTGSLISEYVIFNGAWGKFYDDAGVLQTAPCDANVAAALVNLEPQQSHAWWDPKATKYCDSIQDIVATFSTKSDTIRGEATEQGINLPIRLPDGPFAFLHDRTAGTGFAITRRIRNHLALSLVPGLRSYTNGPNTSEGLREMKAIVDTFLSGQIRKGRLTAASTDVSMNTAASMALGQASIGIDGTSPAAREKIFLLVNVGPTVTVREAA